MQIIVVTGYILQTVEYHISPNDFYDVNRVFYFSLLSIYDDFYIETEIFLMGFMRIYAIDFLFIIHFTFCLCIESINTNWFPDLKQKKNISIF
jgi:hypothetical protein